MPVSIVHVIELICRGCRRKILVKVKENGAVSCPHCDAGFKPEAPDIVRLLVPAFLCGCGCNMFTEVQVNEGLASVV